MNVFDSTQKLVKEIVEYAIVSQSSEFEDIVIKEHYDLRSSQTETIDNQEKLIVTEYIDSNKIDLEDNEVKPLETESKFVKPQMVKEASVEQISEEDYKIEDVSNKMVSEELELQSQPIVSLFKEEKIIKIDVEKDFEIHEMMENEEEQDIYSDYKIKIETTDTGEFI